MYFSHFCPLLQLDSLRATTETKEITYRIAYGLKLADMHKWGLYVSHPRNIRETEHPFPEPAMFLMNPEGKVQVAEYSNSPFCRPDLRIMIEGKLFHLHPSICNVFFFCGFAGYQCILSIWVSLVLCTLLMCCCCCILHGVLFAAGGQCCSMSMLEMHRLLLLCPQSVLFCSALKCGVLCLCFVQASVTLRRTTTQSGVHTVSPQTLLDPARDTRQLSLS